MNKEYISVSISFPDKEKLESNGLIVPSEWIAVYSLDKLKSKREIHKDRCFDGTRFVVTVQYNNESEGDA